MWLLNYARPQGWPWLPGFIRFLVSFECTNQYYEDIVVGTRKFITHHKLFVVSKLDATLVCIGHNNILVIVFKFEVLWFWLKQLYMINWRNFTCVI